MLVRLLGESGKENYFLQLTAHVALASEVSIREFLFLVFIGMGNLTCFWN